MTLAFPTLRQPSIIPGFKITMGFTLAYLALIVIIPLSGLFFTAATLNLEQFTKVVTSPRVMSAYKISFGIAFAAALVNCFFGLILAWILARYRFPLRKLVDAAVDLPFALPTAVAGIALTALYAPHGWIGQYLAPLGIKVAFTPLGIMIALVFVGLPFVVRTVQPILEDLDKEVEEAAMSLGASRLQIFLHVILPTITPALLTGFAMAFARGLGEYGSVIFIAGNIPGLSEIVPLLIVIKLEQYDYPGATAIACVMLIASFILLFIINWLQQWTGSRFGVEVNMRFLRRRSSPITEPLWVKALLMVMGIAFVSVLILLPVAAVFAEAFRQGIKAYMYALTHEHAISAIKLTLLVAAIAVPCNLLFGVAASWAIAKFNFAGKRLLITFIDLPFSVSPVISGLIYVLLFGAHGVFGAWLSEHHIQIIFAVPGLVIATIFVTFPFVARELIPLMEEQGTEEEEAAIMLGAGGFRTFWSVTLPNIKWALLYGVLLCNARAMGEFGAVSVVSGHIKGYTNTVPLQVEILYNEYNFVAAFAVASILTILALVTLLLKTVIEFRFAEELRAQHGH